MKIIDKKDEIYPKRLLQIPNPPKQLYVEGDYKLLNQDCIAIIGTRKYTKYGELHASEFARELSQRGITIVSGMALGIDSIAHINSMECKGKTIAVLGSGFNNIFPKENLYLYEKILENGGCVITEYSPEVEANKENFPKRNRIISGIAMGVLVIEARYHSGSSITAKIAKKQGKEVFCIPHELGSSTGYIPNSLIQNGAQLVISYEDIFNYYYHEEIENIKSVPEEYKEIYNLIGQLPIQPNQISKKLNVPISKVTEVLCILEIEGYITNLYGNNYIRALNK